jgi:hypothetical protein
MAMLNARAARASGVLFAVAGAAAVLGGVGAILVGWPEAAHGLMPLGGPSDLASRFGEVAPVLSAAIAALVAAAIAVMTASRTLDSRAAALELIVLGLVVGVCVLGALGRVGHAADGSVLPAAVVCLMGGAAVLAGGVIAMLGHE